MLQFSCVRLEDRQWVAPMVHASGAMGCESTFGNLYVWQQADCTKVCRHGGWLLRRSGEGEKTQYAFPLGQGDLKQAVDLLRQDAAAQGAPFVMHSVTKKMARQLEELYPGRFAVEFDRGQADYIYACEDLLHLAGKKYHGKRNHIAKFKRTYSFSYEPIGPGNLDECRNLAKAWCQENGCGENGLNDERRALQLAFDHYEALGFLGGLLRVEGQAAAFTIGEPVSDQCFVVHFEKALSRYPGAYPMINQQFVQNALQAYHYINREEDLGLEGLRKAKLSYHPAILLEKGTAREL